MDSSSNNIFFTIVTLPNSVHVLKIDSHLRGYFGNKYMINMNYRSRELVGANLCTFSNTSVNLARYARPLFAVSRFLSSFEIDSRFRDTSQKHSKTERISIA